MPGEDVNTKPHVSFGVSWHASLGPELTSQLRTQGGAPQIQPACAFEERRQPATLAAIRPLALLPTTLPARDDAAGASTTHSIRLGVTKRRAVSSPLLRPWLLAFPQPVFKC